MPATAPPRQLGGTALTLRARDGYALAARRYRPTGSPGAENDGSSALVLMVPATGVALRLYDGFASSLAAHGHEVLTWDWRGTGGSRPPRLRGFAATMRDWATLDLGGVLDQARAEGAGRPLVAVGHSFGGQCLGLAPGAEAFAAAVTVAAQSGWWGHWPRPRRYRYAFLWYVLLPSLVALLGYFPSRRLGIGEDLPRGVALEWARWCRSPRYLGTWEGHRRLAIPLLAYSLADDDYAPRAAAAALLREYSAARVEHRHLTPAEAGMRQVGHFGFFRPGAHLLWQEVASWIGAHAVSSAAPETDRSTLPEPRPEPAGERR